MKKCAAGPAASSSSRTSELCENISRVIPDHGMWKFCNELKVSRELRSAGILPAVLRMLESEKNRRRDTRATITLKYRASRAEWDVHDCFEIDRLAMLLRGAEFPLRECFHRVRIQLRIDAVHQLDAVHAAILANNGIEHNLAIHVRRSQLRRVFRIHF